MSTEKTEKDFFRVEEEPSGSTCTCEKCKVWTVVYEQQGEVIGIGTSYEGELGKEAAEDLCDLMNMAFVQGVEMVEAQES